MAIHQLRWRFSGALLLLTSVSLMPNIGHGQESVRRSSYAPIVRAHQSGEAAALRIVEDVSRHRLWILTVREVYVYDTGTRSLILRLTLPWGSVIDANYACWPALLLDTRGAAFIASNVEPVVLQIDPDLLRMTEHRLRITSRRELDTGFGALAIAPDGTLFGLSASGGAFFNLDLARGNATEVALVHPAPVACSLSYIGQRRFRAQPHVVSLCIGSGRNAKRLDLSGDLARGIVTNESCDQ